MELSKFVRVALKFEEEVSLGPSIGQLACVEIGVQNGCRGLCLLQPHFLVREGLVDPAIEVFKVLQNVLLARHALPPYHSVDHAGVLLWIHSVAACCVDTVCEIIKGLAESIFNAIGVHCVNKQLLSFLRFPLPLQDRLQFLLDADHCLQHKVHLEAVKGVVLDLKLRVVALNVEEPGTSLPINLEAELEQLAELAHRHLGTASVSRSEPRFDKQEHQDNFGADSVPEDLFLLFFVCGGRASALVEQFQKSVDLKSVQSLSFAESFCLEVSILSVVHFLAKPGLDVVKDGAAQSLERLDEDVD